MSEAPDSSAPTDELDEAVLDSVAGAGTGLPAGTSNNFTIPAATAAQLASGTLKWNLPSPH